jgi:hypothetical protein
MELIYELGTPSFRGQWPRIEAMLALAPPRPGHGDWAHPALELQAPAPRRARHDAWGSSDGHAPSPPVPDGVLHDNSAGRVAALVAAGVQLQLISPGPSIDACLQLPSNLAAGVFSTYNRYLIAYCRADPNRLGAVLQLHGSEPRWSAHEVAELHSEPAVRAVSLCLPVRISPEEPNFEPLWEALERAELPVLHRPALCARIWTPGRLLAYLEGAGVLGRYPGLRFAVLAGDGAAPEVPVTGSRVFTAASAAQLHHGVEGPAAMLWASDFPLRGSLSEELAAARRALGARADEVLVAAPQRFLVGV